MPISKLGTIEEHYANNPDCLITAKQIDTQFRQYQANEGKGSLAEVKGYAARRSVTGPGISPAEYLKKNTVPGKGLSPTEFMQKQGVTFPSASGKGSTSDPKLSKTPSIQSLKAQAYGPNNEYCPSCKKPVK